MAVSKRLRFEILRRDNHTCRYCGVSAPNVRLTVDHVIPTTLGGSDDPSNLVAACVDCNAGKSSVPADAPLVDDVTQDAIRFAAALQRVSEMRARDANTNLQAIDWFDSVWCAWTNSRGEHFDLPDGPDGVLVFLDRGLAPAEIEELVSVAMRSRSRDKWRYFCGCCWKRIRENIDMAAELVAAEGR